MVIPWVVVEPILLVLNGHLQQLLAPVWKGLNDAVLDGWGVMLGVLVVGMVTRLVHWYGGLMFHSHAHTHALTR